MIKIEITIIKSCMKPSKTRKNNEINIIYYLSNYKILIMLFLYTKSIIKNKSKKNIAKFC